ncbi:hypothetical protein CFP56_005070 [Quercus suber]|uniref:Uncharacterized protein n=1 Tax=Quercus suber TaxID=58331 RepID=A0AAW0LAR8_QUESU
MTELMGFAGDQIKAPSPSRNFSKSDWPLVLGSTGQTSWSDLLHSIRKLEAYDIIQESNQLTNVTRLPVEPFMFVGHI